MPRVSQHVQGMGLADPGAESAGPVSAEASAGKAPVSEMMDRLKEIPLVMEWLAKACKRTWWFLV